MRIMTKLGMLIAGGLVAGAATVVSVSSQSDSTPAATATATAPATPIPDVPPAYAPKVLREKSDVDKATETRVITDAARTAWAFVDQGYVPETGLVNPNRTWPYPTIWD